MVTAQAQQENAPGTLTSGSLPVDDAPPDFSDGEVQSGKNFGTKTHTTLLVYIFSLINLTGVSCRWISMCL